METGLLSVAARPRYVENFATLVIGNISLKLIPVSNTSITPLYNSSLIYNSLQFLTKELPQSNLLYRIDSVSLFSGLSLSSDKIFKVKTPLSSAALFLQSS